MIGRLVDYVSFFFHICIYIYTHIHTHTQTYIYIYIYLRVCVCVCVCVCFCETYTFSSTVTGETFKVSHKLNCDDKCLIYLLTCECCGKQYVGETTGEFRFRWNNFTCNDTKYAKNEDCFQEILYRHPGFLKNVKARLIDETDGQNP